jgi:hypothetical protein
MRDLAPQREPDTSTSLGAIVGVLLIITSAYLVFYWLGICFGG